VSCDRHAARAIVIAAAALALWAGRAAADTPVETWGGAPAATGGIEMPRGRTRLLELTGQLGVQEGVVLGERTGRAPLGLKPLFGVNFLEIGSTRLMLGATLALPFSVEIGYGEDIAQVGLVPGVVISRRECANWGWFAGLEVPVVITPERREGAATEVLGGLTLRGGAAWYFLAGLGIYGEADVDIYIGRERAVVLGVTGGLVLSYEMFRFTPGGSGPAGGGS
jgi:hypothetical protein